MTYNDMDIFGLDAPNGIFYAQVLNSNGTRSNITVTQNDINAQKSTNQLLDFSNNSHAVYVLQSFVKDVWTGYVYLDNGNGYGYNFNLPTSVLINIKNNGYAKFIDKTTGLSNILNGYNADGTLKDGYVLACPVNAPYLSALNGSACFVQPDTALHEFNLEPSAGQQYVAGDAMPKYVPGNTTKTISNPLSSNYVNYVDLGQVQDITSAPVSSVPYTIFQANENPIDIVTTNPTQTSAVVNNAATSNVIITQDMVKSISLAGDDQNLHIGTQDSPNSGNGVTAEIPPPILDHTVINNTNANATTQVDPSNPTIQSDYHITTDAENLINSTDVPLNTTTTEVSKAVAPGITTTEKVQVFAKDLVFGQNAPYWWIPYAALGVAAVLGGVFVSKLSKKQGNKEK